MDRITENSKSKETDRKIRFLCSILCNVQRREERGVSLETRAAVPDELTFEESDRLPDNWSDLKDKCYNFSTQRTLHFLPFDDYCSMALVLTSNRSYIT